MDDPIKLTGKVHQVGAGGIGFWMAVALARSHVDLTVYDFDNLQGGLGWSRMPKASPETAKVSLLRGFCLAVMGDTAPKVVNGRFEPSAALQGDLVVDACDMALPERKALWEAVRAQGARILRVSYDGAGGIISIAEGLPFAGKAGGGYRETPNLALSFAAGGIGALVVQQILDGHTAHVEFQINVSELISPVVISQTIPELILNLSEEVAVV